MKLRITDMQVPDDLPIALGSLTTVLVATYFLAPVIAESAFGRPSSMLGLGFIVGSVIGVASGAAAFLIAMGVRSAARRAGMGSMNVPRWLTACVLLATVAAVTVLGLSARAQTIAQEFARRPRVIVDSGLFVKAAAGGSPSGSRVEAPLLHSMWGEAVVPSINWNGRSVSVADSNEHVAVVDDGGARLASTDLHAFDYIGSIRAAPYCRHPNGQYDLAVLVVLRATSNRAMLIVYDPDGATVYQEHLERTGTGNRWAGSMYVASLDGREVLVVEHGPVTAWTCGRAG